MLLCNLKNNIKNYLLKMTEKHVKTPNTLCDAYPRARGNKESEKKLEADLVEGCRRRGGMAVKLTSQFHRGLPDRLVLLPFRTVCFVELKSTGEKRTALQEVAARQLEDLGLRVFVVDSSEALWEFFMKMDKRLARIRKAQEERDGVPTA